MATAKTGSFYLTETVTFPNGSADGTTATGEIDLGAYVSVANGQAIAIDQVDFILQQGPTYSQTLSDMLGANSGSISFQVADLNPGGALIRADDQSLVASGALNIDEANNIGSETADFYPDNYGSSSLSEAFLVVNDSLYLTSLVDSTTIGAQDVYVTARIRCRIVKLSNKDWVAIAIQSTASDN